MYDAFSAGRYDRQGRIRQIDLRTGRALICFVCGPRASIDRDDAVFFVDLLYGIDKGVADIDLLLHTGGGDIDAAEKLASLVRSRVGQNGHLRIIVPDYAKSAGTLLALGADVIVMSDASELGPIDPQITFDDGRGNRIQHSILSYLAAYDEYSSAIQKNASDTVARIMLSKLDPATVKLFQSTKQRALSLAENLLKRGMQPAAYTKIPRDLMDLDRWPTHGQMIDHAAAKSLGLTVEYMEPTSDGWQAYWRLYCRQRLAIKDGGKLFESQRVSLVVGGAD